MVEISVQDEILQVEMERRHVVILGAGASRAAFPDGELNGRRLPLMADFCDVVPVGDTFRSCGIDVANQDFEEAYSKIARDPTLKPQKAELEYQIYQYFDAMALPDHPTIYDHLLLSLRNKDVVATFNWDPFLIQAARRNRIPSGRLPFILFLHGNVKAGYCEQDEVHGVRGVRCPRCGRLFSPSRLLYPVTEKNYEQDPMIADSWRKLRRALQEAFMVTIFGYSAPTSDTSAIKLLQDAWGSPQERALELFEIVDVKPEKELLKSWRSFIHTHHYQVHSDIYDSWILNHPRRTGEAYINQYINGSFIEDNPVPREVSFEELWRWFSPLFEAEGAASSQRGPRK